jgi:hypothetical protein
MRIVSSSAYLFTVRSPEMLDVVLDADNDLILLEAGEIDTDEQLTWGLEDFQSDHVVLAAVGGVRVE